MVELSGSKRFWISFTNSGWKYLLYQLIFIVLSQQIGRLIWFIGNVYWLQPLGIGEYIKVFLVGFYFDAPVVAYCFLPVWIWWSLAPTTITIKNYLFRGIATVLIFTTVLLNAIDAGYSNVTSKRSGKELLDVLADPANNVSNYIIDYWWGVILILVFGWVIWRFFPVPKEFGPWISSTQSSKRKTIHRTQSELSPKNLNTCTKTVIYTWSWIVFRFFFVSVIILFLGRGGTRLRPLRASDAAEFVVPEISPLLVSTPFSMISSFQSAGLTEVQWLDTNIEIWHLRGNATAIGEFIKNDFSSKKNDVTGKASAIASINSTSRNSTRSNVVLIVVESLARDYTGFLNGAPYTPFLDKLAKNPDAVVFPFCFANGTKSIEMAPSIFAGMPNLMEDFFITSSYSTNRFTNVFGWMKSIKYTTQFFHGSNNGTMGFRSFFKGGGLQEYYGIDEYPNKEVDFDGHWGIFDEPYLQYVSKKLTLNQQPFFSSVFTLSSHHPYAIPESLKSKFPGSNLTVQKTIAYADYSLEKFFQSACKEPWFENTIFIITGDHTSHGTLGYFYSPSGHYEVPFMIFAPGKGAILHSNFTKEITQKSCSQLDILPTTLSFALNVSNLSIGMGRSLLDSSYKGYSYHYDKGLYYIIQYPYVLIMNERGETMEFYQQRRNSNKKESLENSNNKEIQAKKMELVSQLKSAIQGYRRGLITNQWDRLFNFRNQ